MSIYQGKDREKFLEIMHMVAIKRWCRARCRKGVNVVRTGSIAALFTMSACGFASAPHNGLVIMGSPDAIRAWNDGQSALVTNGKASPDIKSAAWQHREAQEKEITQRETAPGFMSNLFGGAK